MPHVFNKVNWCLKKAATEMQERRVHRGLLRIKPDINLAGKHILKAKHNLAAAVYFKEGGFSDWSASAFFYCIYHCFLAILRKNGYESRNQECTIAVIEMLNHTGEISIDPKFICAFKAGDNTSAQMSIIQAREDFQYDVGLSFDKPEEFNRFLALCNEMLNLAYDVVYES